MSLQHCPVPACAGAQCQLSAQCQPVLGHQTGICHQPVLVSSATLCWCPHRHPGSPHPGAKRQPHPDFWCWPLMTDSSCPYWCLVCPVPACTGAQCQPTVVAVPAHTGDPNWCPVPAQTGDYCQSTASPYWCPVSACTGAQFQPILVPSATRVLMSSASPCW